MDDVLVKYIVTKDNCNNSNILGFVARCKDNNVEIVCDFDTFLPVTATQINGITQMIQLCNDNKVVIHFFGGAVE